MLRAGTLALIVAGIRLAMVDVLTVVAPISVGTDALVVVQRRGQLACGPIETGIVVAADGGHGYLAQACSVTSCTSTGECGRLRAPWLYDAGASVLASGVGGGRVAGVGKLTEITDMRGWALTVEEVVEGSGWMQRQ